jgi:16S rRNA C1402 (ribose-2'-O) methylase RsmI
MQLLPLVFASFDFFKENYMLRMSDAGLPIVNDKGESVF